jgi:hypothetical protein
MPFKAYVKTDALENPEAIIELNKRLLPQGIITIGTERDWKEILDPEPFLYFRNPYLRFSDELSIIHYHYQHRDIPFIAAEGEVISVSSTAKGNYCFGVDRKIGFFRPSIAPLPILMGTHQRPLYLKLTLNSLLHSIRHIPDQKIYIVVSQPDDETSKIIEEVLANHQQVEAVLSEKNLKYAFANFGSKFFQLPKFVHHEDDGIIPENLGYFVPYWTQQLNYRSTTADLVTFRIFEGNWTSAFHKSEFLARSQLLQIPSGTLWHYSRPAQRTIVPMGGMGMVINSETMYRDFKSPTYNNSDHNVYFAANAVCLVNVPIYHIGANYEVDYPAYASKKQSTEVAMIQSGKDLRTGQIKTIDLSIDWKDGAKAPSS